MSGLMRSPAVSRTMTTTDYSELPMFTLCLVGCDLKRVKNSMSHCVLLLNHLTMFFSVQI